MSAPKHPEDGGIARIAWIVEKTVAGNMSAFDRLAGLGKGRTEQILKGRSSTDRMKRDVAILIARAGNVRLEWLQTGRGPREPFEEPTVSLVPATPPADPYPSRVQFLALARAKGADDAILTAIQAEQCKADEDPGIAYWRKRYAELQEESVHVEAVIRGTATATPDASEKEVIARRTRKK